MPSIADKTVRNLLLLCAFVAAGACGALLFAAFSIPAAYLSGSMVAVTLIVVLGPVAPRFPAHLSTALFTFMGLSMGAGVTPEVVERIHTWPVSLALLAVSLFAITGVVFFFLVHASRWDRNSAYFASIPGALSYVLATMQDVRGDAAKVAQSQSLRVFLLIAILPTVIVYFGEGSGTVPPADVPALLDYVLMFAGGIAGALVAMRLGIPGGALVGAFVASALLHGLGLVHGRPPQAVIDVAFVLLGTMIGLRFRDTTLGQIRSNLVASLGAFALSFGIAVVLALAAARALDLPFGQTVIAFAPGGLEAMVMLAFMLDLDPAYVAVHQLGRFFAMILLVPVFARILLGRDWRTN